MNPNYTNELKGFALAIDLGGTNLRVCSVELHGDTTCSSKQLKVVIPREVMVASHASALFSFIALQVKNLLLTYHSEKFAQALENPGKEPFILGFTFSFPVLQTGINSGTLLRWTKGFDIQDAVGKDICHLLQLEINLLGLPVKVAALINDGVGTIMSRAYSLSPDSTRITIGIIFGTGTNGVYLEKISNIKKNLEGDYDKISGEMFISTDWGSFNNLEVLPVTPFDLELDKFSVNPGLQIFEKRVSGMLFLGELLRLTLVHLENCISHQLFSNCKVDTGNTNVSFLQTRWTIDSSILSIAEADDTLDLHALKAAIGVTFNVDPSSVSLEEAQAVKSLSHAIGRRAARLAGMATAAVVLKSGGMEGENCNPKGVDIAVDGSVIELYPGFERYMREVFRVVDGIGENGDKGIRLAMSKDGSSVGAAITSLLCSQ